MNKVQIAGLLERMEINGVRLWHENGKLKFAAPQGVLTPEMRETLKLQKENIISFLKEDEEEIRVIRDEENRFESFPLTDIQSAYLMGRNQAFALSGVACHIYMEFHYESLDAAKAEYAWNVLIKRHDALRTCFYQDGTQRVLEEAAKLRIDYADVSGRDEAEFNERMAAVRERLGHCIHDAQEPPLMAIAITNSDKDSILHFSMDFIMADWTSITLLMTEFEEIYFYDESNLPELDVNFRDYLIAENQLKQKSGYNKDKKYWMDRVDELPAAPDIAVKVGNLASNGENRFKRLYLNLDAKQWNTIKNNASKYGLTPSSVVLSAYAHVLNWWSSTDKFLLNLTVLNRFPLHEQVGRIIGDFTSVSLLECDFNNSESFAKNTRDLNARLFEDLDHRLYSGVMVMREIARRKGREAALMPFVYTSSIGVIQENPERPMIGSFTGDGISQTPQVYLDCQAMDSSCGLHVNWDYRDGVFYDSVIEDMFDAFKTLLFRLSESEEIWLTELAPMIPQYQKDIVMQVNQTQESLPVHLLHSGILDSMKRLPDKTAAVDENMTLTYNELELLASAIKQSLIENGSEKNETIGVVMPKSVYQIASTIAILDAQGAYVPVDIHQAPLRREKILSQCNITKVITLSEYEHMFDKTKYTIICADILEKAQISNLEGKGDVDSLAYIIYTSGSTGTPKGVAITHKAAVNTIEDINKRFDVTENDAVLGLSLLNFDLSVYDIFGVLAAGGCVVYPAAQKYSDPSHWMKLIKEHNITLWNSVPAFMQMLVDYIESDKKENLDTMRVIMMSGDWIPVTLPERIWAINPDVLTVSLGGATEASIWSIYHICREVKPEWKSIPYGKPLANQGYRVLNKKLQECPFWVQGDLYITGAGLADSYYREPELTSKAFFEIDGERVYKTGDTGRWMPNGEIEFMGRNDGQLKIHGHRIELGEIDSCIVQCGALQSSTLAVQTHSGEKILVSFYCAEREIADDEMREILKERLPSYMIPSIIARRDALPLTANGKLDKKQLIAEAEGMVEKRMSSSISPEELNETEKLVHDIVTDLLKLININKDEDLYTKGADSLMIGKAAGIIREKLLPDVSFDTILAQLLRAPTIRGIAEFVESQKSADRNDKNAVNQESKESFVTLRELNSAQSGKVAALLWDEDGTELETRGIADVLIEENYNVVQLLPLHIEELQDKEAEDGVQIIADSCVSELEKYKDSEITIIAYGTSSWFGIELAGRLTAAEYQLNKLVMVDARPINNAEPSSEFSYSEFAKGVTLVEPGLYMGDLLLICAENADSAHAKTQDTVDYWSEVCLGAFDTMTVHGEHDSIMREAAREIVNAAK